MAIPIQSACDPNLPEEHALWALVGLAGPAVNAPLVVPVSVLRKWSEHLYRCGFRHDSSLQEIKYIPPQGDTDWIMAAGGRWVSIDEQLPAEVTAPDLSHLTAAEKRVIFQRLAGELNPADTDISQEAVVSYEQ